MPDFYILKNNSEALKPKYYSEKITEWHIKGNYNDNAEAYVNV